MNKKYQLHTGIKDIIQTNGTEPIRTVQLANILADYSAYDEYPATKVVLKDVLTTGYGQRIYNTFNESGKNYLAEIEMIKQDYSKMLEQPREMGEMTLKDFVPMSLRCQMRSNRKSGKCKEKQNIAGERFANHYPRRCKI